MGEIYIGCGFIRGKLAGIYYDILGRVGGRLAAVWNLLQSHSKHRSPRGPGWLSPLASRSHRRVTACTPARRGLLFYGEK